MQHCLVVIIMSIVYLLPTFLVCEQWYSLAGESREFDRCVVRIYDKVGGKYIRNGDSWPVLIAEQSSLKLMSEKSNIFIKAFFLY